MSFFSSGRMSLKVSAPPIPATTQRSSEEVGLQHPGGLRLPARGDAAAAALGGAARLLLGAGELVPRGHPGGEAAGAPGWAGGGGGGLEQIVPSHGASQGVR